MQPFVRNAGAFEVTPVEDSLLVQATPQAERTAAARALARLADAHDTASIAGARAVPRVLAVTADKVRLACKPLFDLEELMRRLGRARLRPSFGFVAELSLRCIDTMEIAARLPGVAVGAFALSNLWLDRDGEVWIVGLGHNALVFDERGRETGAVGAVVAPEVAAGAAPTPQSELFAASRALLLGLLPHIEVPPILQEAFIGRAKGRVAELVAWANDALWSPLEPRRRAATPARMRDYLRELCAAIGVGIDGSIATTVRAALESTEPPREALVVASDKTWFRAPHGTPVELVRRPILRALLGALVEAHSAGRRVPSEGLIAAAWPGDRMSADSAKNRLHVALHALRRLGLGNLVTWTPEGYSLDVRMPVVRS
jgi:hypothetical protein